MVDGNCPKCGAPVSPGWRVCGYCGASLIQSGTSDQVEIPSDGFATPYQPEASQPVSSTPAAPEPPATTDFPGVPAEERTILENLPVQPQQVINAVNTTRKVITIVGLVLFFLCGACMLLAFLVMNTQK
jgi:hypothetical protein